MKHLPNRQSYRLRGWNYASEGVYFITICTKDRLPYFGYSPHDLSVLGEICKAEWLKTPSIRPDMNLELGAFVVMPDHFHAVLYIGRNAFNTQENLCRFGFQAKNLASVVRGFKSSVTTQARKLGLPFAWQSRFFDRIMRSDDMLNNTERYIQRHLE